MTPFPAEAVAIGVIGGGFAFTANMLALVIVGEINKQLPENQQVSYWGWSSRIRKQHKQLYPGSKLVFWFDLCGVLMFLSGLALLPVWVFA